MDSAFLAQETARSHQKHDAHHHVDHGFGRGGKEHRRDARRDADQETSEKGARQASESSHDDGDKTWHDEGGSNRWLQTQHAGRQYARETCEIDAETKVEI